jgi:UDP-N-acetylmuramoyl-L-alanyl-D-glutamate--2,6-diaminopimelate ligase
MKIKKLIQDLDIEIVKGSKETEIWGITNHSKSVGPGFLYIAKRGKTFDGNDYVPDAILAGACAIVTDIFNPFLENIVQLICQNIEKIEPILASRFYKDPAASIFLVGVTGTSGKTTSTYLTSHLLNQIEPTGIMGSIERRLGDFQMNSDLNTPDAITCQKMLHEMLIRGGKSVCMEVSSHGLSQNRVEGIFYDIAVFTNLTPEHLDYHKDMEEYGSVKKRLFSKIKKGGIAVVNIDDPRAEWMIDRVQERIVTYGIEKEGDYKAKNIRFDVKETTFTLVFPKGEIEIKMPLIGRFNVYNALVAIVVAMERGVTTEQIQEGFLTVPQVLGRMEKIEAKNGALIFVDYAHKAAALEKVLETLKEIAHGKIVTVFGCGGDRDRNKRPLMGKIAERFSDLVIVTNDNPRGEDPEEIIEEILSGFSKDKHRVILDRKEAISVGIKELRSGDVLLIAGKGHEKVQIIEGREKNFDDAEVAKELIDSLI